MKKLLFILPFILLLSCSVQKRKYQKGFYVSGHKHKQQTKDLSAKKDTPLQTETLVLKPVALPLAAASNNDLIASANNKTVSYKNPVFKKKVASPDSLCDKITLKNGDESFVKIYEISPTEIKYKRCDMLDGPLYVVKKSDVFMIKYSNGTKELFNTESTSSSNEDTQPRSKYKGPQKTHPMAIAAFVLGILGIWPLTGLASIFAVLCANSAIKKIRQSPDRFKGNELAMAGKIMGKIVLGIIAAAIVILILAAVLAV